VEEFVKCQATAPAGFFACEAAGLHWLGAVAGGVRCAEVIGYDEYSLTLRRLSAGAPPPGAAREFGCQLALTHDAGAASLRGRTGCGGAVTISTHHCSAESASCSTNIGPEMAVQFAET
jgi:fructosamine-3-kinase